MERWYGGRFVVVVAAVLGLGVGDVVAQEAEADDQQTAESETSSVEADEMEAVESDADSTADTDDKGEGEEDASGWRSVYVGAGTGYLLGVDTYIAPHQRIGTDISVWRNPLFGNCDPSCFRRTEFRIHWTWTTGNQHVNGGVMAGLSGGRVRDRESERQTRTGAFIGPLIGFRGSYTPSSSVGIGTHLALTPSYFSGTERVAAPEPSPRRAFRVGLSAALVLEFGNPQKP